MSFLILLFLLTQAAASVINCGLPVHELYIDPPAIVAANQPVNMRIVFEVPHYTYVPNGLVEISTIWNGVTLTTEHNGLEHYIDLPLFAGHHTFERSFMFPANVWGRVSSTISVYNSSGVQLLCAQWIVFATGTDKNETVWPWTMIYT
jgi:hypothetical protein